MTFGPLPSRPVPPSPRPRAGPLDGRALRAKGLGLVGSALRASTAGLALALALAPAPGAALPPGGGPGPGAERGVGPDDELPPRQPPLAPDVGGAAAPGASRPSAPEDQAVLVQGYVKTASKDRLVLSAPGTKETLTLSIDPKTEVLSADENVSVEGLRPGQLVRAALVPSGDELVAVVVEVMPGEPQRSPGAEPRPRERPAAPRPPASGAVPNSSPSGSGR